MNCGWIPHSFRKDWKSLDRYSPPLPAFRDLIFTPDSVSAEALNSLNFSKASDFSVDSVVFDDTYPEHRLHKNSGHLNFLLVVTVT